MPDQERATEFMKTLYFTITDVTIEQPDQPLSPERLAELSASLQKHMDGEIERLFHDAMTGDVTLRPSEYNEEKAGRGTVGMFTAICDS